MHELPGLISDLLEEISLLSTKCFDIALQISLTNILLNTGGLVFLLILCRTENLIIQWESENELIEICHVFNICYSGIGASWVAQIQKIVLLSGVCTKWSFYFSVGWNR